MSRFSIDDLYYVASDSDSDVDVDVDVSEDEDGLTGRTSRQNFETESNPRDNPSLNDIRNLPTLPNSTRPSAQFKKTFSALNNLRNQRDTCDVVIVCGDEKFPAHRLVLHLGSAYFEAMFSSGMREACSLEIQFPTIPAKLMSLILDFIYIQQVNVEILSTDEIWELLTAAHLLELYSLVEICIGELTKKINFGNWALMLQAGRRYLSERLVVSVVQYLVHHDLTKDSDLLGLDIDCFNSLIMTSSDQNLHSADMLINLILNWVMHDENDRKQYLSALFTSIDFTSASREIITSLIKDNNLVKNSIETSHLLLSKISPIFTDSLSIKTAFSDPKLLFFKLTSVHSFDLKKKEWFFQNLPITVYSSPNTPIAVSNHAVYFTADIKDNRTYQNNSSMYIVAFYPHDNSVNAMATHSRRYNFGMIFLNDALYLTGGSGQTRDQCKHTLEKLDVKSGTWTTLANPMLRRLEPMIVAVNGDLFVFGGYQVDVKHPEQDQFPNRVVEKYSTSSDQWTVVTVVPNLSFSSFTVASCFSKIYLRSAASLVNDVCHSNLLEFDPEENVWKEVMVGFKPSEDPGSWWLCRNNKQLSFIVVRQGKKYYKVDPRTQECVFITEKMDDVVENGQSESNRREREEFKMTIIFA